MGPYPAMLDIEGALREEFGEDGGGYSYAELEARLDRLPPVKYYFDVV